MPKAVCTETDVDADDIVGGDDRVTEVDMDVDIGDDVKEDGVEADDVEVNVLLAVKEVVVETDNSKIDVLSVGMDVNVIVVGL
ncbi:MAG: hypothetical protein Q9218_002945 [Villophora microphyllina]